MASDLSRLHSLACPRPAPCPPRPPPALHFPPAAAGPAPDRRRPCTALMLLMYRRRYQYTSITDWTGGLYISPGFAGSRSGALIATAWASLVHLGEEGFLRATGEPLPPPNRRRRPTAVLQQCKLRPKLSLLFTFSTSLRPLFSSAAWARLQGRAPFWPTCRRSLPLPSPPPGPAHGSLPGPILPPQRG